MVAFPPGNRSWGLPWDMERISRVRLIAVGRHAALCVAFLALTGSSIRDEHADGADQMRQMARMWRR